jgi:hypothetical protein
MQKASGAFPCREKADAPDAYDGYPYRSFAPEHFKRLWGIVFYTVAKINRNLHGVTPPPPPLAAVPLPFQGRQVKALLKGWEFFVLGSPERGAVSEAD